MIQIDQSGVVSFCQFNTKRMIISPWDKAYSTSQQTSILEDLMQMLTPDVLAFLPPSMQVEDKAASEWIAERNTESIVLAAQDRQTNTLLGLLILTEFMKPDTIEVRLGYLFAKQHWGKGYATELLHGLIDWCNQTNRPMKLLGGVEKGNKPSAKVLEKAGFGIDHTLSSPTTFFYRKDLHSH